MRRRLKELTGRSNGMGYAKRKKELRLDLNLAAIDFIAVGCSSINDVLRHSPIMG
jgi:hypothetical protein